MSNSECFDRARWWLSQGVELVPIRSYAKAIITGYGVNSNHITTEKHAWLWFEKLGVNLGVICGGMIGLACVDFDDAAAFEAWRSESGQTLQTLTEQTDRGYHLYIKCLGLPSISTPAIEIKTHSVVMVAPSVHPSGKRYEIVNPAPIASLTVEQVKTTFPFVSSALEAMALSPKPDVRRRDMPSAGDLISRIKAGRSVLEEASGLTDLKGRGGHYYGLCPFHDDHEPSFWVDDEAGLWGCYSPRCPTNTGGQNAHDVINLRMFAGHMTARDAIRALANEVLPGQ
jgi:hypothetical protein